MNIQDWFPLRLPEEISTTSEYTDDSTLMAESEGELINNLIRVKEESEKAGLKLNIQKTKIMMSDPISSWKTEKVDTVTDILFLGSRITADGDCSHEIQRRFLLGEKTTTNLLLLLLSCFSSVRLCATPETAAHQAPPSLGFSETSRKYVNILWDLGILGNPSNLEYHVLPVMWIEMIIIIVRWWPGM